MKRKFDPGSPELMDRPQPVSLELENDLANLRSLNRWFGSHRLTRKFIRRWLRDGTTVLDLATASGDLPRLVVELARQRRKKISVTAIDQSSATIEIARKLNANYPEIEFRACDLFAIEGSYDVVLCSLALHHFTEEEAVCVLEKCASLSRRAVLVSDLRRAPLLSAGVWLITALFYRAPMTRIDARLSAARAFSFRELRSLAERAGWKNFRQARFAVGRQAIWMESTF